MWIGRKDNDKHKSNDKNNDKTLLGASQVWSGRKDNERIAAMLSSLAQSSSSSSSSSSSTATAAASSLSTIHIYALAR